MCEEKVRERLKEEMSKEDFTEFKPLEEAKTNKLVMEKNADFMDICDELTKKPICREDRD